MKVKRRIGPGLPRSRNVIKFLRKTTISGIVLLVLFLGGGVAYTWYMGQNIGDNSSATVEPLKPNSTPVVKHAQTSPDAKVGVSIQSITSPVSPGSNTSVSIKTNAGATCTITAVYNKIASTDSGLAKKVADDFGIVSWTWTVEESVPPGKWPVTVTCANSKNSGVYTADLVVAKQTD